MALARRIAARLAEVRGVAALVVGGSVARGTADAASDLDLGLYYRRADGLDVPALRALAAALDGRAGVEVTEIGGWGPHLNGGAWLVIEGRRVDWIYREVESVADSIAATRAGRSPIRYQPGHPLGWQPQIDAGEVAAAIPLIDRDGAFAKLVAATLPYPVALRDAKLGELWEARFALENAVKPAQRGDVLTVAGHLFRAAALLVQAHLALAGHYLVNEKGALAILDASDDARRHAARIRAIVGRPGSEPAALAASVAALMTLVDEVDRGPQTRA